MNGEEGKDAEIIFKVHWKRPRDPGVRKIFYLMDVM